MNEISEVLDAVARKVDWVLATVVAVDGSAYRKAGAMTVLLPSGKQVGMISVGCLEEDLAVRAERLRETADIFSEKVIYDLRAEDDLGWGRGVGCNGRIHVVLEKANPILRSALLEVRERFLCGEAVTVMRDLRRIPYALHAKIVGEGMSAANQGKGVGAVRDGGRRMQQGFLLREQFFQLFEPKPRLYIFGAGLDVKPLIRVAEAVGFLVFVVDRREEFLYEAEFPTVTYVRDWRTIPYSPADSVVVMTHDFQWDREILQFLEGEELCYLGVLGPRQRAARLLNVAEDDEIFDNIHSPVGLTIGADGAEEIAISIVGDLIRVKRGIAFAESIGRDGRQDYRRLFSSRE